MNPLQYWYMTNSKLKIFMDEYFNNNISYLSAYPELKKYCESLFINGNGTEKNQVLSVLSIVNYLSS